MQGYKLKTDLYPHLQPPKQEIKQVTAVPVKM